MSAAGFTPIQLYRTTTASAVPSAGNLADGELAINLTDEALYFKNASGVVTLLADSSGALGTVTSVAASGGTTGLTFSGSPITTSGTLTLGGTLAVANGGTGVTTSTGTGSVVLSNSPTLTTPNLGTPSAVTLTNATGLPLTTGVTGTLPVANGGTGVTTSTGTGSVVLSNSPTLVTPTIGAASATSIANGLGAVGTPSYTFTGDTNTGMWSPAADTIAFSEGGVEAMRIDSSGNVGIGTSSPAYPLDVTTTGAQIVARLTETTATLSSRLYATCGTATGIFQQYGQSHATLPNMLAVNASSGNLSLWTLNVERMRIDNGGNVGIGTSSPLGRLTVNSGSGATVASAADDLVIDTAGSTGLSILSGATALGSIHFGDSGSNNVGIIRYDHSTNSLSTFTNATERMRTDSIGNVGIGTSSPAQRLDVRGGDLQLSRAAAGVAGDAAINFGNSAANYIYSGNSSNIMAFAANGSERMRINASGNVGIGTSSPARKLFVTEATGFPVAEFASAFSSSPASLDVGEVFTLSGTSAVSGLTFTASDARLLAFGASPNNRVYMRARAYEITSIAETTIVTNSVERMRIDSSGNVGIGTSSPTAKLDVVGVVNSSQGFSATSSSAYLPQTIMSNYAADATGGYYLFYKGRAGATTSQSGDTFGTVAWYGRDTSNTAVATSSIFSVQTGAAGAGSVPTALVFSNGGNAERMRIDNGGNVGIGTSAPAARLDVIGNIFSRPGGGSGAVAELTADASSGANGISLIAGFASGGYGPIRLLTSATERMRIDSSGNVGIGTSSPDYKLDVNGTFGFTPGASVTPVDNGDVVFELTNNTTLTIKAKGSDGVVRSGTITLT